MDPLVRQPIHQADAKQIRAGIAASVLLRHRRGLLVVRSGLFSVWSFLCWGLWPQQARLRAISCCWGTGHPCSSISQLQP